MKYLHTPANIFIRRHITIVEVSLHFLRPNVQGLATQLWIATHYLRTLPQSLNFSLRAQQKQGRADPSHSLQSH